MNAASAVRSLLAGVGPVVVGVVFLFAALTKAVAPSRARRHLDLQGLVPAAWRDAVATATPLVEAAAGAALLARIAPQVVLPAVIVLLAALTGLTVWSTATKRTDDCGCYGGLEVRPRTSVLLNTGYMAALALAWRLAPSAPPAGWRWTVVIVLTAAIAVVTVLARQRLLRSGRDLVDLRPLRPGRRWDHRWLGRGQPVLADGEAIVAFLGESCPLCKLWLRPLGVIHRRGDLPTVLGVLPGTDEDARRFTRAMSIGFPVVAMAPTRAGRLVDATPTIAVVHDGLVRSVDTARLPPNLLTRVRRQAERSATGPTGEGTV